MTKDEIQGERFRNDADHTALRLDDITVDYQMLGRPAVRAVKEATLSVRRGEIVGVVGESGSGKTTLGRVAAGFVTPTMGAVRVSGTDGRLRVVRNNHGLRDVQMIFQESALALDPHLAVWRSVAEALPPPPRRFGWRKLRDEAVRQLNRVHLDESTARRRPSGLSGGEKQRVAIARALAAAPSVVICDEAVSALDVTVRLAILELIKEVVDETGVALVFISHDISVVSTIADTTVVMSEGEIVEQGTTRDVLDRPTHAYTKRLIDAVPPLQRGVLPADPLKQASPAQAPTAHHQTGETT